MSQSIEDSDEKSKSYFVVEKKITISGIVALLVFVGGLIGWEHSQSMEISANTHKVETLKEYAKRIDENVEFIKKFLLENPIKD
jgi:hypothetical protein